MLMNTTDNCAGNADCENLDKGFECPCLAGFYGDDINDGNGCSDVNECDADPVPCPDNSSCVNNACDCDAGFIMNADSTACDNVDEYADADATDCHD